MKDKKVVVIIGGSKGIGRATAELFYKEGWEVHVTGRSNGPLLELTTNNPGMTPHISDALNSIQVEQLFTAVKELGRLDVLVLSAAPFSSKSIVDTTEEDSATAGAWIEAIHSINRQAFEVMEQQKGGGVIVNISSRAGIREDVLPKSSVYAMIKGGMTNLTRSINQESDKVRVLAICPGLVSDTEMGQRAIAERPGMDNGQPLTSYEVAAKVVECVGYATKDTPDIYRLTAEEGLEPIR